MTDKFKEHQLGLSSPIQQSELVDIGSTDHVFTNLPRAVYFGGGGTLKVQFADDSSAQTFDTVAAGVMYPWRIKTVFKTGTSASNIIGLF